MEQFSFFRRPVRHRARYLAAALKLIPGNHQDIHAHTHGTDGHAVAGAALPGLAGLPAGYFSEQMTGFKSGTRPATVMTQLARGFSDAQIEQMARFFAAQPK